MTADVIVVALAAPAGAAVAVLAHGGLAVGVQAVHGAARPRGAAVGIAQGVVVRRTETLRRVQGVITKPVPVAGLKSVGAGERVRESRARRDPVYPGK